MHITACNKDIESKEWGMINKWILFPFYMYWNDGVFIFPESMIVWRQGSNSWQFALSVANLKKEKITVIFFQTVFKGQRSKNSGVETISRSYLGVVPVMLLLLLPYL